MIQRATILSLLAGALFLLPALEPAAAQDATRLREIQNRLAGTRISLELEDASFEETIQLVSKVTGVNLVIAPALRNEGVGDFRLTLKLQDIPAKDALSLILEFHDLGMTYRSGVMMITTKADARGKPVLRLYSISDLTFKLQDFPGPDMNLRTADFELIQEEVPERDDPFEDPEYIVDIVRNNVMPETWDAEGVSITATKRFLVVRQSPAAHAEIARLLMLLRAYK